MSGAVRAQPGFEETEFVGWTTVVHGLLDRAVSGGAEANGGAPGSHYLVRHEHEFFEEFFGAVTSRSMAPAALDPVAIGLNRTVVFSADFRFDIDIDHVLLSTPYFVWSPVLEQGGALYRPGNANVYVDSAGAFGRFQLEVAPTDWRAGSTDPGIRLGAGAPPVRVGLVIQSNLPVPFERQGEAFIRFDNLRIDQSDPLPVVTLVGMPSAEGDHVVFAPPGCFDGIRDFEGELFFEVEGELLRPAERELCVTWRLPQQLELAERVCPNQFGALDTGLLFEPGSQSRSDTFRCGEAAPTEIVLVPSAEYTLGVPSRVRPIPCWLEVGGELQPCHAVTELCAVEAAFQQICQAGHELYCEEADQPVASRRRDVRSAVAVDGTGEPSPLDTLRRVRDETMSVSSAGRYYRDLYDAFSPELRGILLGDLRIVRDVLSESPPWLDALGALVDGGGSEVTVTADMVAGMLAIFDRFEEQASPAVREVFRRERERLGLEDVAGLSLDDAVSLLEERGGAPPCATTDTSLCLQGGRFRVEVTWSDGKGGSGAGRAVSLSGDSGYFWFFDEDNVELVLKVLDGHGVNDRYWVFYGALSDVEYTVLVTDTETGALRAYRNPPGVFASVGDTEAFDEDGAPRAEAGGGGSQSFLSRLSAAASETLRGAWGKLRGLRRESVAARGTAPLSLVAASGRSAASVSAATAAGNCVAGANALCLAGHRFRVEVEWRDFQGGSGFGRPAPLTGDTGTFWFFDPSNTELIVKVLDGRSINGKFWVFYGALSNVEYTLRVTDTATGRVRSYRNPSGMFVSRGDVEAF